MNLKFANTLALILAATSLQFSSFHHAQAGPLVNGDFAAANDLAGWTPTGNLVSEPTGAFAQLETNGAFQRTLEQSFTLPVTPARLVFDFAFSTSIADASAVPPRTPPDSFTVSLWTTVGNYFLDILVADVGGAAPDPSDGMEGTTGALPIDVGFDTGITIPGFTPFAGGFSTGGRINLLLPAVVRGLEGTLYFDLFDQSDGATTRVALDNISVEPVSTVPAPATLGLMLIGLAAARAVRRIS
jgi:hypothetical protein